MAEEDIYLVCVDDTAGAKRAVSYALAEAGKSKASLIFMHVVEWSGFDAVNVGELSHRHADKEAKAAKIKSDLLAPLVGEAEAAGIQAESAVLFGDPGDELLKAVKKREISHIFTSTHGRSTLKQLVLGSVTRDLVAKATVPVTVVP